MRKAALFLLMSGAASYAPAQESFTFHAFPGSRTYLGVNVAEVDTARARELKLKEERGVEIKKVEPGSPAEKAGLKESDVVLEYNSQRVEGTESFIRMVRETPAGRVARMQVSRDGNVQAITATLAQRKETAFNKNFTVAPMPPLPAMPPMPPMPPMPSFDVPRSVQAIRTPRVGLETESLSGQLADFFGVKEGVLVRAVDKDSPADKAGLKAGDVVLRVDGQRVNRPRDVTDELRNSWDKKTVPVVVVRNKKEMTLNMELPERSGDVRRGRVVVLEQEKL